MAKTTLGSVQKSSLEALKKEARWVVWSHEERDGKKTKVPRQPNGDYARVNDPSTWVDYATAQAALPSGRFAGVGIVLGDGLVGVDIDCKDYKGDGIPPIVREILDRFPSYAEISPSDRGFHILLLGRVPHGRAVKRALPGGLAVEVYESNRYFTFTGRAVNNHDIVECQEALNWLLSLLAYAERLDGLYRGPKGEKIRRLFEGDWQGLGYPSQSEADQAAAYYAIEFCKGDREQAKRLLLLSNLRREKWFREVTRGISYLDYTLDKALESYLEKAAKTRYPAQARGVTKDFVDQILSSVEVWQDPEGRAWTSIRVNGHIEHWEVRSYGFNQWVSRLYFKQYGKIPGRQTLQDILEVVEGEARFGETSHVHPVFHRGAFDNGTVWLDLGRKDWRAVRVTTDGWEVTDPGVRFRRSKATGELPIPQKGTIEDLYQLLDFWGLDQRQKVLVVAFLLSIFTPGPYPVLVITGEQGSGKSTFARFLKRLVDPTMDHGDLCSFPRSVQDLFIVTRHHHVIAWDNINAIPAWLAERVCTGRAEAIYR